MATDNTVDLATLRFDGKRFEGHALDVECTQELLAYRTLVLECAKELWRRKNPDRVRLPKRFEDGFRLQFDRVIPGSAALPLRRVREVVQGELDFDDDFDEAAALIDQAITAADRDDLLPDALPANVVPLFRDFGGTLRADETLFVRSRRGSAEAVYGARARQRLAEWIGPTFEDAVDLVGEVRMANVGPGAFKLQLPDGGPLIDGRFDAAHETVVLEALKSHRSVLLRVAGIAEFSTRDRQMRRLIRVDKVEVSAKAPLAYDETALPIWEELAAIGNSAPPGTWQAVPDDLSTRIDEVVYGTEDGRK
ncbi:MAG: hypothetical protein HS128_23890 [Ideonella sp.]|nr:hypothetical protein [Ideonella sp.]